MGVQLEPGRCLWKVIFLHVFKHKTIAAEQDGAYSESIQNVFKLNTPWIQDSRFEMQGKVFSRILNLGSMAYSVSIRFEYAWDPRFKIERARESFPQNF